MKSRSETEMIRAYSKLHDHLVQCGLKPQLQKVDNEAPSGLKKVMKTNGIDYQLVLRHLHCRNAAKHAISTFKDHFIAGLASTDGRWPMHLWCRLLPKCTMTLNLLRASQLNPNYQPKLNSMEYLTLIEPNWHLQAQESSSTKNPPSANHGRHMGWLDGTWAQPSSITDATRYTP
jgi:hypothetical protein